MTFKLPASDTHCFDTDTNTDVWSYSREQLFQALREFGQECSEAFLVQAAGWEKTKGCTPMAGFIASANCADAIREKIKELK